MPRLFISSVTSLFSVFQISSHNTQHRAQVSHVKKKEILTKAICGGFHWYTMRCLHLSQRCISARQMTDNIFEIETAALVHVACEPRESCILFTDFVNHSWIFHVLDNNCLILFVFSCEGSTSTAPHVEFAGMTRGQFFMARGVRHAPSSVF